MIKLLPFLGFAAASALRGSPQTAYKMQPDASVLKWLNSSAVIPGGTACGFMNTPLGIGHPHIEFPFLHVYVCVRFADTQPAPLGPLFNHCGGPGTTSDCFEFGIITPPVMEQYDIYSIDQRGLGRSTPSFMRNECAFKFA